MYIIINVLIVLSTIAPPDTDGWLSAYEKSRTDATYNYRLEVGDIQEGYDVYIAVPQCDRIGETGLIYFYDHALLRTYQVFDCASRNITVVPGYYWMTRNNIIGEVDYYTWQEIGLGRASLYKSQVRLMAAPNLPE